MLYRQMQPTPSCPATTERCRRRGSPTRFRFEGRKRVHNADEIVSEIIARRLV